jgi:hypothetical protein
MSSHGICRTPKKLSITHFYLALMINFWFSILFIVLSIFQSNKLSKKLINNILKIIIKKKKKKKKGKNGKNGCAQGDFAGLEAV